MNAIILAKYFSLFTTFSKIGLFSFGGGNGTLEIIRYNAVDVQGWVTQDEFGLITGVSIALPGLNALNTSCIIGYKVAGIIGAIISIVSLSLPSLMIVVFFYELLQKFLSPQAIKSFEIIMQYAVIVLVMNMVYSISSNLVYENNTSLPLTILSLILFIALANFKLDSLLGLILYIMAASFIRRM